MELCYFLMSCALFVSDVAFSLPSGPLELDKNVSLVKKVKRSDLCAGRLCRNGGRCEIRNRRPVCRCTACYTGENCEISKTAYCEYPGDISNGGVVNERVEKYPEGSPLEYSCDDGYTLVGSSTLICRSTGSWSSRSPICKNDTSAVAYCEYPGDISNGGVVNEREEKYPEGSPLEYSCDDGYTLEGSSKLICRSTGSWSSRSPTCKRGPITYCEYPGDIRNGGVVNERVDKYWDGRILEYSCDDGYTLEGSSILICRSRGSWSSRSPTCKLVNNRPISCKHPGNVDNAQVRRISPMRIRKRSANQQREVYPPGTRLHYKCDDGYILRGRPGLYCRINGSWTTSPPFCEPVTNQPISCKHPGNVDNAQVRHISPMRIRKRSANQQREVYPPGTRLRYKCDKGYILRGRPGLYCSINGSWTTNPPLCEPDCGRTFMNVRDRRSSGSIETNSGDWPWVVSISVNLNDEIIFLCGGAVLNTHTVITAAHCLANPLVSGRTLILHFGKHEIRSEWDDDEVLVRKTSQWLIHPDYNNKTFDSDIALVFLQNRIRYSIRVQPLCLPTPDSAARNIVPGNFGYISGWGETEHGLFPDVMMLVTLPVVSNSQCEDEYRRHKLQMTSDMFCAGHEDARKSVCSGDSGSPFIFYDKRIQRYVLEGLASFGENGQCGVTGKYAIFTKVFRFMDWIIRNKHH